MPEPLPTPPTWAPGCVRTRPGPVPQPSSATSPDLDQATLRRGAGHPASTRPARPAARDTSGPPAPGTPGHTSSVLTCAESSYVESAPSSISRAVQYLVCRRPPRGHLTAGPTPPRSLNADTHLRILLGHIDPRTPPIQHLHHQLTPFRVLGAPTIWRRTKGVSGRRS